MQAAVVGLLVLFSATLAPSVWAEERPTLTLAAIEKLPSAELATRIMARAYAKLDIPIDVVPLPANRALIMAVSGEADADMMRIAQLKDRYPSLVQVPYPLLRGELRAATLDTSVQVWNRDALADRRVAIRRGVVIAEAATAGLNVTSVEDPRQFLAMLERGRVDMLVVSVIAGLPPIDPDEWAQLNVLEGSVADFTLHHYLHQRHAELAMPLADTLARMEASGETASIIADFLAEQGISPSR
ncbi:substrate-binding periplasmic protein [Saccharospirillum mangrovi]|uniref:substrate-binding periplasmic protein n=1 Tax=Saccharospirillum mangrovi TaxID=2161747 RepID=UPI000D369F7D|nr:transporter substrate-binding domain-containing protein [Saccharospirillum mangrovi]